MNSLTSVRDLINLWPTRAELQSDLKAAFPQLSVSVTQVHKWAEKQSIPARYQHPILHVAKARGFDVSADLLLELHAASRTAA